MRSRIAAVGGILLLALTGCASVPASDSAPEPVSQDDGHGEIAGAHELAEPALHLATIDSGTVSHLDLLDEESETLAEIDPVTDLETDGRFLFAIRDGSVTVIDSGVWTWSHIDHFHYYEAPSRVIGDVIGEGVATVVTGATGTGILFADEAVLLDTPALADGELRELFRIDVEPHTGLVVPLAKGAAITEPDAGGVPQALRIVADDGTRGESIPCADAAGTITTVVGVVIGCADGAVMATGGDAASWERIPVDAAVTADAGAESIAPTAFAAREARPTVAALAGETSFWLLDTRQHTWTLHDIGEPIVRVAAVDDAEGRVLAIAADGSLLVLVDGAIMSRTEPLVAASLADPALAEHVDLVVDQTRAYLNGPAERMLWEIDPADGARIARTFDTDTTPLLLAGTGR